MSSSEKEVFDAYVQRTFPQDAPRSRSAVAYGKRYVKGNSDDDKHFRHLLKRSGFRLSDFLEAGIRDALVVPPRKKGSMLFVFDLAITV